MKQHIRIIYFILPLFFLVSSCFEPELPGEVVSTTSTRTPTTTSTQSPSSGSVTNGLYKLETREVVEFDQVQVFSYYKERKGDELTSVYTHVFKFNDSGVLNLEMIKKANNQSFQSEYKPEGDWEKTILLDSNNKFYYYYSREYSLANPTIEALQTTSKLELVIRDKQVVGCKFNNSTFFKTSQSTKE